MVPFIAALLVGGGAFAIVVGLAARARARQAELATLVEAELAEPTTNPESLAELMEKAGMLAERMLSRTSTLDRIQLLLTRAGYRLRPGEFVGIVSVCAVVIGTLTWILSSSIFVGGAFAAASGLSAVAFVSRKSRTRILKIEEQLPTILELLAGSLEAGSSVLHAFELVVEEGDPPLAHEFARVVAETKVGRPLLESLEALATRIGSRDLDWTVEAIRIQQQSGGKLAETLRVLAEFMRARIEVRGEVRALSAEARLSGKVLTALPICIGLFMFGFRRSYFEPLYATSFGRAMLVAGALGIVAGSWWMRRLVRVEV
jgi:tight adherence protein B